MCLLHIYYFPVQYTLQEVGILVCLLTDVLSVSGRNLAGSRGWKVICGTVLKLLLAQEARFPSCCLRLLSFEAFLAGGSGLLVPACWHSPTRLPHLLLPAPLTLIHCSCAAPTRHEDNLLPKGCQPNAENPVQMWGSGLVAGSQAR